MRNSLILYSEWYEILMELPDEERLQALDAILRYGFEDIEPTDKIIKRTTALIFKGIDKTRFRYEEKCEKNRQNIAKRWGKKNTKAYDRIQSIPTNTKAYDRIQSIPTNTNDTNYNYNYNYNDELANANNIKKKKENVIKEKEKSEASFIERLLADQRLIESQCMQLHCSPEEWKRAVESIAIEWEATDTTHGNYNDAASHMLNVVRIRIRDNQRNGNNMQVDNRPPRPSVHHIWSESQQKWVYSI